MAVVPAGSFTIGSPVNELERENGEAQERVSIAAPFAVGRFAVTFEEWDACVADGACNVYKSIDNYKHTAQDDGWGRGDSP
jgi:formylglycine-generating enzyme required for sulfatase activity